MTSGSRPKATRDRQRSTAQASGALHELAALGLRPGDRVRFRKGTGNWREGTVTGRERDGSVGLTDDRHRARAITADRLELRTRGPRGGWAWEPVAERASRPEQLDLF